MYCMRFFFVGYITCFCEVNVYAYFRLIIEIIGTFSWHICRRANQPILRISLTRQCGTYIMFMVDKNRDVVRGLNFSTFIVAFKLAPEYFLLKTHVCYVI